VAIIDIAKVAQVTRVLTAVGRNLWGGFWKCFVGLGVPECSLKGKASTVTHLNDGVVDTKFFRL
jgi:hypothetical protein